MLACLINELRRRRALRRVADGPMHAYLSKPLPGCGRASCDPEYLSLDIEATGLDPKRDHILSVGYVVVSHQRIQLASARHRLIKTDRAIPGETAIIHQITDDMSAAGEPLTDVLQEILELLAGRILLAHHCRIEQGFLDQACRNIYGVPFIASTVDTLERARRLFEQRHVSYKAGDLRLHALRERYHLPRYRAHNALSDAIATAELFLAL